MKGQIGQRLEVSGLSIRYPGASSDVLRGIDLDLTPGRPHVVLGADAAGKSTLLAALAGLVPERVGGIAAGTRRLTLEGGRRYELGGGAVNQDAAISQDADAWLEHTALLLEDPLAQITFSRARVDEEVAIALESRGVSQSVMAAAVQSALENHDIEHLRSRHPAALSVGEAARVAFASACISNPSLMLFDEPTAHLDGEGRRMVLERIQRLIAEGALTAIATQDLDALEPFLEGMQARATVLAGGRALLEGTVADVFGQVTLEVHGVARSTMALAQSLHEPASLAQKALVPQAAPVRSDARDVNDRSELLLGQASTAPAVGMSLRGVSAHYEDGTPCIRGLDLELQPGEIMALVGSNGAGKTSIARVLAGLLPVSSGKVSADGQDITERLAPSRARLVGLAFQRPEDQLFERTVEREVAFGPRSLGRDPKEVAAAIERALGLCDLSMARRLHPYDMTRAGRRWIGLASTLALETPIVVLDEPTVGLGHRGVERLKNILGILRRGGRSIVIISHDLDLVAEMADAVAVVDSGRVLTIGAPSNVLLDDALLGLAGLEPAPAVRVARELRLVIDGHTPLCRAELERAFI